MLDSLRKFATSWPGKILGAFLLVGLAGFGITGVISSIGGNTVARIGDKVISATDFQRAYSVQVNVAAQQLGSTPTPDQAISLGIPGSVLTRLATDQALNILNEDFGLGVSDQRLGEILSLDPTFSGGRGSFDRAVFQQIITQNGYTENEYLQTRREAAERQQAALGLFSRARMPDTITLILQRFGEDRRILDFSVVGADSLLPVAEPTDAQLGTYLAENQANYRNPETRNVRMLVLTPDILAQTINISDADVQAEYERTKDSLVRAETRTILQYPLPTLAEERWFEFGLQSGKTFSNLMAESGTSARELGALTSAEIADDVLAEAAFSLNLGDVKIIESIDGKSAISVTNIAESGLRTFAEARQQITSSMKLAEARSSYIDIVDLIEEQRAAFIDMARTANEFGLEIQNATISPSGATLTSDFGYSADEAARIAETIYATQEGGLAPSLPLTANKTFWFDLLDVTEASDQSVEQVRPLLAALWTEQQRAQALSDRADLLVKSLDDGTPFSDAVVAQGLFPQISQPVSRTGDGGEVIDQNIAIAAYGGGQGFAGTARNANGDVVVFQVVSINTTTDDMDEQTSNGIASRYRDDLYSEFASSLREDAQLRVNQDLLTQILQGGPVGGGGAMDGDHGGDGDGGHQ